MVTTVLGTMVTIARYYDGFQYHGYHGSISKLPSTIRTMVITWYIFIRVSRNIKLLAYLIIITIIFSFNVALNTNVSKRFTNILLHVPRSLDLVLACTHCVHNLHSLLSIPAMRYLTLKNCLTNNDGRILTGSHLTHGWRVASGLTFIGGNRL